MKKAGQLVKWHAKRTMRATHAFVSCVLTFHVCPYVINS